MSDFRTVMSVEFSTIYQQQESMYEQTQKNKIKCLPTIKVYLL